MPLKRFALLSFIAAHFLQSGAQQTFTNPLLPSGADPWCIYKSGFYYYTHTTGRNITLWKTDNLSKLPTAEKKIVFTPPQGTPYAHAVWAPELHYMNDHWYLYFAANSGNGKPHYMWVLENTSADPLEGTWEIKGKLETPEDKWSIDGTLFQYKNRFYFLWSGWEGDANGQQNIYIAKMKNPWTIEGGRVTLSRPSLDWEMHGDLKSTSDVPHVNVNEGPQVLQNGNRLFLIYSASGCWTDYYALGMLSTTAGSDIMDSAAWVKSPQPVFTQSKQNAVYGTGHNSFFKSPDGTEDWILYHANNQPGQGCGKFRSPRAQKFTWKADGSPDFGEPVKEGIPIAAPSSDRQEHLNQKR